MQVAVVSEQPAFALALGAQLEHGACRAATTAEQVRDLVSEEGSVALLDVGGGEALDGWLMDLRRAGVECGIVVITDDQALVVQEPGVVVLHRPFAFSDLAVTLAEAAQWHPSRPDPAPDDPGPSLVIDLQPEEPDNTEEAEDEAPVAQEPSADDPIAMEPPAEDEAAPTGTVASAEPSAEEDATPAEAPVTPEPAAPPSRPGVLGRLLGSARRSQDDTPPTRPVDGHELVLRVRSSLASARELEDLLEELPALGDAEFSGAAALEELQSQVALGGVAVALRSRVGYDVVAMAGEHTGVRRLSVDLQHPFLARVAQHRGALLLSPTDDARGLLAGIPLSSWPALATVEIPGIEQPDGLVFVGLEAHAGPDELSAIDRAVGELAELLSLAAVIRRLRGDGILSEPPLRSWQRDDAARMGGRFRQP